MDDDQVPFDAMAITLKELNIINTRLGGHSITIAGLRSLIQTQTVTAPLLICEIGCGGGDNLAAIDRYCKRAGIRASFIGIDMNAECISFAKQQQAKLSCEWICSDYALVEFKMRKPDIIFSSLFCHHFTDEQLLPMLGWLRRNSAQGYFINDLQRHWLAYYLIKYITKFFSRSYLVKNDAKLSVARSFRRMDWTRLFEAAGQKASIRWRWAFRFLVIHNKASAL